MHSYLKKHPAPQPPTNSWSVDDLYDAYGGKQGAYQGGGVICIIELGGGWVASDTIAAFHQMGLPTPTVTDISVDGTTNSPGGDADGEVALDIQVAGAVYSMATGHAATIEIYWAQDIGKAVEAAAARHPGGMLVFAASGDNDSGDGGQTPANVDCPASCPSVIGCGGTSKPRVGPEVVWNNNPGHVHGSGTGGGYSTIFPAQSWQLGIPVAPRRLGRMVPDVAGVADPDTGYMIVLNGHAQVFGGTSAVAPFYAGLFAAFGYNTQSISWGTDEANWEAAASGSVKAMEASAKLAVGPLDWVVQTFYKSPLDFFNITHGDNGFYKAGPGPDPCTGMGVPNIALLGTAFAPPPP